MAQRQRIVAALKRVLKARGVTYARLARELGLSEASVKRIFSRESLTVDRLESICSVLGMSILELAKLAEDLSFPGAPEFTEAQERALAEDPELFSFLYMLLSHGGQEGGASALGFGAKAQRLLLRLNRIGVLELYPGDRYRLLISRTVRWRPEGPLMSRYSRKLVEEFFDSTFEAPLELRRFVFGRLSAHSFARLKQKMLRVLREFEAFNQEDRESSPEELSPMGLVVAMRPWSFSVVERARPVTARSRAPQPLV